MLGGGVLAPPVFAGPSELTVASPPPPPLLPSAAIVPTTATPIKSLVQMLIPVAVAFSVDGEVPSAGRSGAWLCDCTGGVVVRSGAGRASGREGSGKKSWPMAPA